MHSACQADLSLYSWENQAFNSIQVIDKDRNNKDTVDCNHNNLAVAGKNFDVLLVGPGIVARLAGSVAVVVAVAGIAGTAGGVANCRVDHMVVGGVNHMVAGGVADSVEAAGPC